MKIVIRSSAIKNIKSISEHFKTKIDKKILELKKFPNLTNIKKLTNFEPAYRYRIGDYRVLFDVEDDNLIVGRVLHRKESYL